MTVTTLRVKDTVSEPVLYMALELSHKRWQLVFGDGVKRRHVTIEAGNRGELVEAIGGARERFRLPVEVKIVSCYEAGRDGFWLHRYLESLGIANHVVDSSSIEVNRRWRRAKTDRIDGDKLLTMLIRYCGGERDVWRVIHVPQVEDEDARRLHREMERLKKERTAHRNRLRGLLVAQGIRLGVKRDFLARLSQVKLWDGTALPMDLRSELEREYARLRVVEAQIQELARTQRERLKQLDSKPLQQVAQLMGLRGIAQASAWLFVMEFFSWRAFQNRRQVASAAGLTGVPYASGDSEREQGISKAGNRRVRTMIIEIAWCWLRFQPQSQRV
jgi:transposase